MNEAPLAPQILKTLARIGAGNGFTAQDFTLSSAEEGTYTLYGLLGVTLEAKRETREAPGRPPKVTALPDKAALEEAIAAATMDLAHKADMKAVFEKTLFNRKSLGFGMADMFMAIPKITQEWGVARLCQTCKGQGKGGCPVCQGTGRVTCLQCVGKREEWCGHCKGSGYQDGDTTKPRCRWCEGVGRTRCLRCDGQGLTACQPCTGSGHTFCRICQGAGEMSEISHVTYGWRAVFTAGTGDMPRAVAHLSAQASWEKIAAMGHIEAQIIGGPVIDPAALPASYGIALPPAQPASLYYLYSAQIPWCEAHVTPAGQAAMVVTCAGLKARVNHCAAFLDKAIDKAARLAQEAKAEVLRSGLRQAERAIARRYPFGLSQRARREVLTKARQTINQRMRYIIITAWLCGVTLAGMCAWFIHGLWAVAAGVAIGIITFHSVMLWGKMRFAQSAGIVFKPAPRFGWEAIAIILVASGIYGIKMLT